MPVDDDPIGKFTSYEMLLIAKGRSPQEAAALAAEQRRINERACKLMNRPVNEWPPFNLQWDVSPANYFHALDGVGPNDVATNELKVIWVRLDDLDRVLEPSNARVAEEVWSVGQPDKAARAIVHWAEGRSMTPVWVSHTSPGKLGIIGGNHRLAVARAKKATLVPLLVERKDLTNLHDLIVVQSPP
jgi:hypothetical protein